MKRRFLYSAAFTCFLASFALHEGKLNNFPKLPCINEEKTRQTSSYDEKIICMEDYLSPGDDRPDFDSASFAGASEALEIRRRVESTLGYECMKTEKEKLCYEAIAKHARRISSKADQSGLYPIEPILIKGACVDSGEVKKAFGAVRFDLPEIFWLHNTITLRRNGRDTIIALKSVASPSKCDELTRAINSKTSSILSRINVKASEYEKELQIHDWLVENCKYDKGPKSSDSWRNATILGPLLDGKAVCEGYSRAFQLLLSGVGIECRTVNGLKGTENHMWNIVKVNGDWYHVDVTWDGSDELRRYAYFNVTDKVIEHDHVVDAQINVNYNPATQKEYNFRLPRCEATKENYFYKNAAKLNSFSPESDEIMIKKLAEISAKKGKFFHIMISPGMDYDSTVKKLFSSPTYKLFNYISEVNGRTSRAGKIDGKSVYFVENKPLRVLTVQIRYT